MIGSTSVFANLLAEMAAKDKIAICRFIARKGTSPRLVALLPQVTINYFIYFDAENE